MGDDKITSMFSALSALTIVLSILKLCGLITWSWVFVTLPLWGGAVLFAIFFLTVVIILAIANRIDARSKWNTP